LLPVFIIGVKKRARRRTAGTGHQMIKTTELVNGGLDEGFDVVMISEVTGLSDHLAGRDVRDLLACCFKSLLVATINHHINAFATERFC
jgi:hypothetical protein